MPVALDQLWIVAATRAGSETIMSARGDRDRGESLVEILIAVVVLGIVASAAFFVISVGATSSKSQRDFVTADALLRDSAEATKLAVRNACGGSGGTYSVAFSTRPSPDSALNWAAYYQTARGFTLPADITGQACPSASEVPAVGLSVTLPNGNQRALTVAVRKP